MTAVNNGVNLWAKAEGQTLHNGFNETNDSFHAIYDKVKMNGGGGADTFHILHGTKGTIIEDFRFGEGDRIKLDGTLRLPEYAPTVTKTGEGDYKVSYGPDLNSEGEIAAYQTTFYLTNLRDENGNILDISADELLAKFTNTNPTENYLQLGDLYGRYEIANGFNTVAEAVAANNLNKMFHITGDHPMFIRGFSADKNRHNLQFSESLRGLGRVRVEFEEDIIDAIRIKQGAKLLAILTPPTDVQSYELWLKNTIAEIKEAAKRDGVGHNVRIRPTPDPG